MANAVYQRTRTALTELLPARVAAKVLDQALRDQRLTSVGVSPKQMAQVLMKGVYPELRGFLPDPGLRRALRQVARDVVRTMEPRGASHTEVREVRRRLDEEAPVPDASEAAVAAESKDLVAEPIPITTKPFVLEATPVPHHDAPSGAERVEALIETLVALDGVHGVARFDATGKPLMVRGLLSDASSLGKVIVGGGSLLERRDALRFVSIDTPHGHLVAVPVHPHWLALTGATDLNVGAVYAALSALEEER